MSRFSDFPLFCFILSQLHNSSLFFRITNYTPDLPQSTVRRAITEAFKVWEGVTDLRFTEVGGGDADIIIQFARLYHQDGYPFDGKGMRLNRIEYLYSPHKGPRRYSA